MFCAVGLDAAGKTTILYKLKLGEIVTTIPTIGTILPYTTVLYYILPMLRQNFLCRVQGSFRG